MGTFRCHNLVVHGVELRGDIASNQCGQYRRDVRIFDEEVLQSRPLPVQVPASTRRHYRHLQDEISTGLD